MESPFGLAMNADAAFQLLASVYSANDSTFFSDNIVQHRNGLIKAFQCLLGLDNTAFDVWQSSVDEAVVVDAIEVFFENQLKHFAFENASIQRLVLIFLLRIAGWNDSSTGTAASNTLQKHTSTFISVQILLCLSVSFKSGGYVEFLVMRSCSTSTNHTKSFDFSTQFVTYLAAQCRLLNQRRTQFEQLGRGKGKADDRVISDSQSQPHSSPPSSTSLPALLEFLRDLSLTCTKIDSFFRLDCHPQDLHDFFPPQSFMKEIATFYNESLAVIRKSFLLVFSKEHSDSTNVLLEAFVNVKLACIRMVDSVLRCLFADSFDQTLLNAATMPFNLEASTPTPPTLDSSIRSSLISYSDFTTTSPPTSSKSLNFNAPSFTPISSHIASVNVPVSSSTTTALDGKNSAAMDTYATNMSRSKSIVIKPYTEKSLSNFLLCMAGESEKQLRDSHDAGIRHYLQDTSILADLDRLTQLQSRVALSNNDEAKDLLKLIEDVTRDNDDAFLTRIISSMEVQEQNTPSLSQVERPTTTWEHLHSKVADLFPDLGLGFIDACLTFFEGNAEAVIESLCENQLPGPLHYLSRSLGLAAISQNTTSPVNGGIGAITAFTIEPPQNSLIASPQVIAEAIKSVKGLFPSLGSGFIECCLDFYQLDVQRLIADLCDNNLPPAVAHLDSSMTQWFEEFYFFFGDSSNRFFATLAMNFSFII